MSERPSVTLRPEFVFFIPEELAEGVLYVSEEFEVAIHRCACGCGEKVVTPLCVPQGGWTLTRAGDTVTLSPSIGNYQIPCRSHYWIERNTVRWAA